jgi:hypothetical protein
MKYLIPFHSYLNESKVEDIYTKYYSNIDSETFNQLISADPTSIVKNGEVAKMGVYSKWLLQLYKIDSLKLEDLYKATKYLTSFEALKKGNRLSGQQADILSFKSLPELFQTISEIGGTGKPTHNENYLIEDRYFINNGQAELYFEDTDYLMVILRTLEASQFYAKDTEWCTQYPDNFEHYTEQGNLYVIIDKRKLNTKTPKRRLQFHFEDSQFMDMDDSDLPTSEKSKFIPYFDGILEAEFHLKYDFFGNFYQGDMATVKLDKHWGYIDRKGNMVVPLKYHQINTFKEGRAVVRINGKYGFVDEQGNEVIPLKYDLVGEFNEGRAWVYLDGKCGFVDKHGNEVIAVKYYAISSFSEGMSKVMLNGKWGFIDLQGNEVAPLKYEQASDFHEGRAWVYLNGKYGFVDKKGNEVVPLKYDSVERFENGEACVLFKGEWIYIDLDGNVVK